MIKCGTIKLDPLTRTHSWDETRHCLDSLTRSDFFEAYCDATRQRGVWTGIPPGGRQVAGCSVEPDRRASDIISLPLLLAMLSPVALRAAGRDHSRSRSMGELNVTSSHRTSPTLDENGSSLNWTCDMNCPMGGYAGMPRQ